MGGKGVRYFQDFFLENNQMPCLRNQCLQYNSGLRIIHSSEFAYNAQKPECLSKRVIFVVRHHSGLSFHITGCQKCSMIRKPLLL